jgi:site-specific recombinase XerC
MDVDAAALKVSRARSVLLRRNPVIDHEPVKFFSEDRMADLLFKGFIVPGKQKSLRIEERLNLRDILITMLMHYGGLRMSEPFHLYIHDVIPDKPLLVRLWSRSTTPVLDWPPPICEMQRACR